MCTSVYSSSLLFVPPNEWSFSVIERPISVSDELSEYVILLPGTGLYGRIASSLSEGVCVEVSFVAIFFSSSIEVIFSPPTVSYMPIQISVPTAETDNSPKMIIVFKNCLLNISDLSEFTFELPIIIA